MIALCAGPRLSFGQDAAVGGVVLAERSLQPVAGALVVTDDSTRRATTDANGRFLLVVPAGASVSLHVRRTVYPSRARQCILPRRSGEASGR